MPENCVRGRFAPSPTGLMHIGNARTALVAWLSVRSKRGIFVWRLEDLDGPRVVQGMAEAAMQDLEWIGIDWDEGPDKHGPHTPYIQSTRVHIYEEALQKLFDLNRIFPCGYSRKDLQNLSSAPHGAGVVSPYPPNLRPKVLDGNWLIALQQERNPAHSIRFQVNSGVVDFEDGLQGNISQDVLNEVGDFVVKRRDGMYAYQLAVVVDDILMEISEVVRGMDLLASTARQIQLIEALGGSVPAYYHVPLVLNAAGEKLSKRDQGLTLRSLREAGVQPDVLVGYLANSLGLIDKIIPISAGALVELFRWEQIMKNDWILPADLTSQLLAVK